MNNVVEDNISYLMTLAHLNKLSNKRKNEIIIYLYQNKIDIEELFNIDEDLRAKLELTEQEIDILISSKDEITNNAFLAESLIEQGYSLISLTSDAYPKLLKENLGKSYAPPIVYCKGDIQIFKEKSIAIVGSRDAKQISLDFTDNIAKKATKEYKVIVSGFAKGVDKQALDSAINYIGRSIIVLPQGITTFSSGYKKYYKQIIDGDVLVLSSFHPKSVWSVQLAMARNPIIYGLANEIYVAESGNSGGTWSGVIDGLRKKRQIYVRYSDSSENNSNNLLIQKGAIPVDFDGNIIENKSENIDSEIKREENIQESLF